MRALGDALEIGGGLSEMLKWWKKIRSRRSEIEDLLRRIEDLEARAAAWDRVARDFKIEKLFER